MELRYSERQSNSCQGFLFFASLISVEVRGEALKRRVILIWMNQSCESAGQHCRTKFPSLDENKLTSVEFDKKNTGEMV